MPLLRMVRAGLVMANASRQEGAHRRAFEKAKQALTAVTDGNVKLLPSFDVAKWREDIALTLASGSHDRNKFVLAIWFDPRTQLYIAMFLLVANVCMYVVDPLTFAITCSFSIFGFNISEAMVNLVAQICCSFADAFMVALALDNLCNCQLPLGGLILVSAGLGSFIAIFLVAVHRRSIVAVLSFGQLGRNMIAATEFSFDLFQQAQNYEFPDFHDTLDIGVCTLSGKVVNYSIMIFVLILDIWNVTAQAAYGTYHAPWLYAQYIDDFGAIWTVRDIRIAETMARSAKANASVVPFSLENSRGPCSVAIPLGIAPMELEAEKAPCYPLDLHACGRLDGFHFHGWHIVFAGAIMAFGVAVMVYLFIFMPKFKDDIERERSREVRAKRIRNVTLCENRMAHLLSAHHQMEPEEASLEDAGIQLEDYTKAPWQRTTQRKDVDANDGGNSWQPMSSVQSMHAW